MRLKLALVQWEEVVLVKVLKQDEELSKGPELLYKSEKGFEIRSSRKPELDRQILRVRGITHIPDHHIAFCRFDSIEKAKQCVEEIRKGVAYINRILPLEGQEDVGIVSKIIV